MNLIKVYKVKIRQNIFRQIILTDSVLTIAGCGITTIGIFLLLQNFEFEIRFFVSLILNGILLLSISINIDRQTLLVILPRLLFYIFRKKHDRF